MVLLGKRAVISGRESVIPDEELFARKGSVIGVYFEVHQFPLSVIGFLSGSGSKYMLCKHEGTRETNSLNCTSSIIPNLVLFAKAGIGKL